MKRILSIALAIALMAGAVMPGFALAADEKQTPFVLVSGMGYKPLVLNLGQEDEQNAFPPAIQAKQIVLPLLAGIFSAVAGKSFPAFVSHVADAAEDILANAACDKDGNSTYNVLPITYPNDLSNYPEFVEATQSEGGLLHSACDKIGAENVYYFNYDWRLSPIYNAELLNSFIENVKAEKKCQKVDLAALSMGGIVTLTYIKMFGSDSIESCLMLCSTYAGVNLAGDALSLRIGINKESLINYLPQNFGGPELKLFLKSLFFVLDFLGLGDLLTKGLNILLDALLEDLSQEFLPENFFTMPGLWATVKQDDYETAKSLHLDKTKNAKLIEKIDFVQYEVHQKRAEIIQEAMDNGVKVYFVANYNLAPPPIGLDKALHSDAVIEAQNASAGATFAPLGDTLPRGYIQQNACCGKNHLSPDRIIDASTSDFPDQVWFVKNVWHVKCLYGSDYNEFLLRLLHEPEQVGVFDSPQYPQFLTSDDNGITLSHLN